MRETCVVSKITNENKTKKVLLSQFLLRSAIGGMLTFFPVNRFFPLWSPLLLSSLCMCVTAHFELSPSSFSLSWNEHGPLTWRHTSRSESAELFNIHEAPPPDRHAPLGLVALIKNKLVYNFSASCPDDAYVWHPENTKTRGHLVNWRVDSFKVHQNYDFFFFYRFIIYLTTSQCFTLSPIRALPLAKNLKKKRSKRMETFSLHW